MVSDVFFKAIFIRCSYSIAVNGMTKIQLDECVSRVPGFLVQHYYWPVSLFSWARAGMMHGGLAHRGK